MGEYVDKNKVKLKVIRLRTWSLTLVLFTTIILYFALYIGFSWRFTSRTLIDISFLAILQILSQCLYFPEGDLFGQRDKTYIANKDYYNKNATMIVRDGHITKLREYCKFEYEERKKRYIIGELSKINLTEYEYSLFKEFKPKEFKRIQELKYMQGEEEKVIILSRLRKKVLYALLFKELPVKENQPETIMSATEKDIYKGIKDGSVTYKKVSYGRRIFQSVFIGTFLGFIGYTVMGKGNVQERIMQAFVYICSVLSTCVIAYNSGENCSKVYKNAFYVDLSNFIDNFFEWRAKN